MINSKITLYVTSWCGDCFRVRRLLDKYRIPYTLIDIDNDAAAEKLVMQINRGMRSVPTLVFEDGTILVEPSSTTLIEKVGLPYAH